MPSLRNQLCVSLVKLLEMKKIWVSSDEFILNDLTKNERKDAQPLKHLSEQYNVEKKEIDGFFYYVLKPKREAHNQIFYFHGGGYVNGICIFHWFFISFLLKNIDCEVYVPLYPLAPKHTYREVYSFLEKMYVETRNKDKTAVFMGDSAGGGLTLGLAQSVNLLGYKKVDKLVMLSPYLDLSLKDERIKEIEPDDPFLASPGLKYTAKLYAGGTDIDYYKISPINGILDGLGEITIVTGTNDILNVDARRLKEKLEYKRIKFNYLEYSKLIHCFMFFPTKEAKMVKRKLVNIIDTENVQMKIKILKSNEKRMLEEEKYVKPQITNLAGEIKVDPKVKYQTITGFGASFTDSSAYLINQVLDKETKKELMLKLFDKEKGIGMSFLRNPMGSSDFARDFYSYDDMPKGEFDYNLDNFSIAHDLVDIIPLTKEALTINKDITLMGSPWSPPGWMKTSDSMIGGTLKYSAYESYANYFVKYIKEYEHQGLKIDYITIQNEPDYSPAHYAGMRITPVEAAYFINNNLGKAFKKNKINTKILAYDHNWDYLEYPKTVLELANKYVAGTAWHVYGGSVESQTTLHNLFPRKETHFTESSGGEWVKNPLEAMFNTGINVLKNYAKSMVLWNIALDENNGPFVPGFGKSTCHGLVTINQAKKQVLFNRPDYFVLGHFSKYIVPGAKRIGSSEIDGLNNVVFKNPDGSYVVVVGNYTEEDKDISIVIENEEYDFILTKKTYYTIKIEKENE